MKLDQKRGYCAWKVGNGNKIFNNYQIAKYDNKSNESAVSLNALSIESSPSSL